MHMYVIVPIITHLVGLLLGYWLAPRAEIWARATRGVRQMVKVLKSTTDQLVSLRQQLVATDALRADWERRASEYRATNQGILEEKQIWIKLHEEESAAHGNAQACMMDAIQFLEQKLRALGHEVVLPQVIRETQQLYTDRYLEPLIQHSGLRVIRRDGPAAETADTMSTERMQEKTSTPENQA